MLTSQPQQGISSPAHLPAASTSAVKWFSQVTVELSYWHGNQRLKNLDQFEWHGDAVMAPALTHAQSKCDFYKIDESSSLELWAFRSQWQVAKVRAGADQHWSFAESLDHVTRVMVSHHPVWSSKHGKISPPDTWPGFTATFQKIISVDACRSRDELNGLVSASLCIFGQGPEAMSLAITNGAIRDLTITRVGANNHSPGCELFKVTGAIEVAMSPYQTESGLDHLEDTIRSSVGIKLSLVDGATATGQLDAAQRSTIWVVERR